MLSPRGWLGSSAPEPRFAFWLASFSSYRRVNGLRAVPLNPSSRLSWRVSSCFHRMDGLGGSAHGFRFAFELASFIMLSPREWLEGSAPEPRFAFKLASYTSCRCVNGLEETAFYLSLPLACLHDVNVEVSHGKLPHRIDKPCSLRYPIIMPYAKGGTPSCTLLPCCN